MTRPLSELEYEHKVSKYFVPIDPYVNYKTKLHAKCKSCGRICYEFPKYLFNGRCKYEEHNYIKNLLRQRSKKQAIKWINKKTQGRFRLLKYKGSRETALIYHKPSKYIHYGHTFKLDFNVFKAHPYCRKCKVIKKRLRSFSKYQKRIKHLTHGHYKLLKMKYAREIHPNSNSGHILFYILHKNKHHCFWTYDTAFYREPECPICYKGHRLSPANYKIYVNMVTHGEYKVLSTLKNEHTPVLMEHCSKLCPYYKIYRKFYKFRMNPNNFREGQRCPLESKRSKMSPQMYKDRVKRMTHGEYTCIKFTYNMKPAIYIHHTKKIPPHSFKKTPDNFDKGERCPYCVSSYGEKEVIQYLLHHGINKRDMIHGYRLHNTDEITHRLHLDVYVPKFHFGIEFDGEQHFHPVDWYGNQRIATKSFKAGHKRDLKKDKYCANHGICLFRIGEHKTYTGKHLHKLVTRQMNHKVLPYLKQCMSNRKSVQLSLF